MSELVLASASPSRQRMLKAAGVKFRVSAADLNETALIADLRSKGEGASAIAATLAGQKAVMVSRRSPGALVLGGDSVLNFKSEIISKCRDLTELRALLLRLSGDVHELISAASLARDGAEIWHHTGVARLTMRPLSEGFVDSYLAAEGDALLSSVGGYRYEGLGAQLFALVEGDSFTILGLPLLPVLEALRAEGILAA
ncbi:MAG TPA: Maf family protein [Rhizomicrobium sp.]|nr:Maf family protein [Rhizomicrobium sp.]